MANFNLAYLPPSKLHKIFSMVATTSIQDFGSAIVAFPEAIYLRRMYELFILHLLDEGREKNYLATERGCLLAKYVDDMMNLAFSVDYRGLVHNYSGFTHDYVDRMYHMITSWAFTGH
ncbi:unnamed protein product [Brassica napus]|uniref:(rape) hypothetical protein n=1 Tax=Brassica napus TaxID=3708 RepID=A0A816QA82_BRANA|nr:unnamed protein product [Brassica napus]